MADCYWIFDQTCICPWRHGYVGVSSEASRRRRDHLRRFKNASFQILFSGTVQECRAVEFALRPKAYIGWNKSPGGQRSQPWTAESKSKLGGTLKLLWTDDEYRNHVIQGRMGRVFSEDTKRKIRESNRQVQLRPWLDGRPCSEETRRKISESNKRFGARPMSEETRQKIRLAHNTDEYRKKLSKRMKGKILSEEHRRKLSEANKRRPKFSKEWRQKLSEAAKRRPAISDETRRKMSESQKQRPIISEETRRKLSESGRRSWESPTRRIRIG